MLILSLFTIIIAVALTTVKNSINLLIREACLSILLAAALSYNALYPQAIEPGQGIYNGLFQVTTITQSMDLFVTITGALIILPWISYKQEQASEQVISKISPSLLKQQDNGEKSSSAEEQINSAITVDFHPSIAEYPLIILFTTIGACFLISSSDLLSVYLCIELQSFALYVLAALYRDNEKATSAGLKYFLLGALSSGFILLGSALIYAYTGITNLEGIYSIMSVTESLTTLVTRPVNMGFALIIVGLIFKIAAAPFHNWAIDVYDGTPTIVTTWLTIMPKISIIILIVQLHTGISAETGNLLLISSVLSLIIGTVLGLAQIKIKRLLAYSTVSHVGFILLALSINSETSIDSLIFYLSQYTITNVNLFLILLAFGYIINEKKKTDIEFISSLKGQFYRNPLLASTLTISVFSIAGIPPLLGFFAKQTVLYSAVHAGYYFISLLAILVSVISAAYYLKIVRVIHFEPEKISNDDLSSTSSISNLHSYIIGLLTILIALYVFKPSLLLNSTSLLALSLFNY